MTGVGHAHDPVTIADRRELPFFMVYTRAVEAIREHIAGPRRVRTIGFYGLLCQLANEQRNIGQQRRVRYSYDLLAGRGGVSKGNIAKMLTCLKQAGVLRRETQPDPGRGGSISIAHLLIHEHSFIAVTVPMADRLAAPRDGGRAMRVDQHLDSRRHPARAGARSPAGKLPSRQRLQQLHPPAVVEAQRSAAGRPQPAVGVQAGEQELGQRAMVLAPAGHRQAFAPGGACA